MRVCVGGGGEGGWKTVRDRLLEETTARQQKRLQVNTQLHCKEITKMKWQTRMRRSKELIGVVESDAVHEGVRTLAGES